MSEYTLLKTGVEARKSILAGVNKVADAVNLTLGNHGRNALLPRTYNRGPRITNDGVTVAELASKIKDPFENLVANSYIESSRQTNLKVGDGTSSTITISGHIINKIFNQLSEQDTPSAQLAELKPTTRGVRAMRKDMLEAKDLIISEIKKKSIPVESLEQLEQIATVSMGAEDAETAKKVAKVVWDIGRDSDGNFIDNHIDVTEGFKGGIETEIIKGMRFSAKIAHRAFINEPAHFEMVAEDTSVFITSYKLDNPYSVIGIIERCKTAKIAFFAPDFSLPVIQSLVATSKNGIFCYPVKCPSLRSEQLEDLAAYTGATLIDKDSGRKLESVTEKDLGYADKIIVKDTENKEDAILLGGRGEKTKAVEERCNILKDQIKEARNDLTRISLERRIANLQSAVGIIRVGATTNNEALYLKLKVEDTSYACKAALEEGYVKGGGLCLKEIAEEIPENILTESLSAPYNQIQKNAGGYFEVEEDVIDPTKVIRLEIEHAVSVASSLITCEIIIPDEREKTEYDGFQLLAKVLAKGVYYSAKHQGMIQESQDEQDKDYREKFEEALLLDK